MPGDDPLIGLLQTTPPACVAGFGLTPARLPAAWGGDLCVSTWRLACPCGESRSRIRGFRLGDYNPAYPSSDLFISPIGLECAACGTVTEILDTDRHGYHAELARRAGGTGSANYRGSGPRTAWPCPQCAGDLFGVTVAFWYWDIVREVIEDEPAWPAQDFFSVFRLLADCAGCGHASEPTDFGKL
jgi:hypothetical protein